MGTMDGQPPPDTTTPTRQPFFTWYKKSPIAWVGTGVTAVGLGLGIGGSIGMGVTSSKATTHAEEIKAYAATDDNVPTKPDGTKQGPCGSTETAGSDIQGYESACDTLRTDLADYGTNKGVAIAGFVFMGVGAIGTAIYAYVDWYSAKPKATTDTTSTGQVLRPRVLAVTPTVTSTYQGIGVVGSF